MVQAMKMGISMVALCSPNRDIRPTARHINAINAAPVIGVLPATMLSGASRAKMMAQVTPSSTPPPTTAAMPAIAGIAAHEAAASE